MFDKEELKKIQEDLPKYMNEHGFELERGELNSEAKHKNGLLNLSKKWLVRKSRNS